MSLGFLELSCWPISLLHFPLRRWNQWCQHNWGSLGFVVQCAANTPCLLQSQRGFWGPLLIRSQLLTCVLQCGRWSGSALPLFSLSGCWLNAGHLPRAVCLFPGCGCCHRRTGNPFIPYPYGKCPHKPDCVPVILDRTSGGQAGDGERETSGFPEGK